MDKKRIILGLDVSTSCLGTSIVSYDGEEAKILYVHYVKMKSSKKYKGTNALFFKSQQFKDNFIQMLKDKGLINVITDIVIEEPLPGSQNVGTVNTLMKFNGMKKKKKKEVKGIMPQYISSYEERKYAFPDLMAIRKYNKKGEVYDIKKITSALKHSEVVLFGNYPWDCAKKNILWNKISDMYPDIKWTYDKNNELTVENFDASDSMICILGFINKEKYFNKEPSIINYNINKIENNIYDINYTMSFCDKIFDKKIIIN